MGNLLSFRLVEKSLSGAEIGAKLCLLYPTVRLKTLYRVAYSGPTCGHGSPFSIFIETKGYAAMKIAVKVMERAQSFVMVFKTCLLASSWLWEKGGKDA
jgi:hypothetical protein